MECVKHPGTQITTVCVTCDTALVCVDCITDELHQGHVFAKPSKIANAIKTKLKTKEAEDCKLVESLESDLKDVNNLKTQQDSAQKDRVKLLNTRREVLHQAVDEMADTFISDYETQTQGNRVKLQDAIDDISAKLETVGRHRSNVKCIVDEKDDLVVVRDSANLADVDGNRKPYDKLATIEFTSGEVNSDQLKRMFGSTASLQGAQAATDFSISTAKGSDFVGTVKRQGRELVLESTFKHSESSCVNDMCNGSEGKTWLRCSKERKITLIDRHGHVEKTVTFDSQIVGMTTISDNTLLVCGSGDRDIKQVTLSSGKVTSVFSTGKLYPGYICTAPGGDLYVTLVDKFDYNVTADSERALVRYSPQGREKGRARHDTRGDALFVRPNGVRSSNTGDVIGVKNITYDDNNHLVILNADLTLRSRYLGDGKVVSGEEKFDTTTYKPDTKYCINDFIFDSLDNIIICEAYSRCVQLLSRDCLPILTLLPSQGRSPTSMTMTGDEMWLGFKDGTVNVYKYK